MSARSYRSLLLIVFLVGCSDRPTDGPAPQESLFGEEIEAEVLDGQQVGSVTQVEIRHARRYEKDPRPRALVLEEQNGQWLIVGYRNW